MESIINFRSFIGLKNKENSTIKEKKLFRSAAPEYGSENDFLKLHLLNLDTVIDFREESEKKILLQQKFNQQFHRKAAEIDVANILNPEEIAKKRLDKENIDLYYQQIYSVLPTHFHHQYQVLTKSLNKGENLLFHCTAGKDRTGFAAYLILSALGVHEDDIMEDYLASNAAALKLYEMRKDDLSNLAAHQITEENARHLFGVQEKYLNTAARSIKDNYKSTERYLTEILLADIHAIREHYLA